MSYSTIDVGNAAINRATYTTGDKTLVDISNPAEAAGVLNSFEYYFATYFGDSTANSVYSGTMYSVFNFPDSTWYARDYESIGNVSAGSKQTFTGKNCLVEVGDSLGTYFYTSSIEASNEGTTYSTILPSRNYFTEGRGSKTWDSTNYAFSSYATGMTVPDAPTLVSATDNLNTKVTVTWTAGTGEAGGHRVYRDGVDISGVVTHGTNYYDDTTGTVGTVYAYTVKAINDAGLSAASSADNGVRVGYLEIHQSECIGALGNLA